MGGQRASDDRAPAGRARVVVVVPRPARRRPSGVVPWRRVLAGVVVAAVVGGVLVATVGTLVSERIAEGLAVRNAAVDTATLARAVVEPALRDALTAPDAGAAERRDATDRLAAAVHDAVQGNGAVRVKVWAPDGTVIWSDEPRLVGQRFTLSDDDLDAIRSDRSDADVSDLDDPENRYERGEGPLLEAYQAVHTPSGDPLLFEVYYRYDDVLASAARLRSAFAGLAFGSVGLVLVLLVPVMLWLLVRIRDGQRERERLLVRALDAQTDERRRIAADLHDGAVQDVAGLAMSLGAAARAERMSADRSAPAERDSPEQAGRDGTAIDGTAGQSVLAAAADTLRSAAASLRSSLSAIQPSAPERDGLAPALDDACARARAAGLATVIRVPPTLDATPGALRAVVRFVREAVANAVTHAGAATVRVGVERIGDAVVVRVGDDGSGFDADAVFAADRPGHLGTTLLRQLAEDTGGSLDVRTAPGAGTEWTLAVPADTETIR